MYNLSFTISYVKHQDGSSGNHCTPLTNKFSKRYIFYGYMYTVIFKISYIKSYPPRSQDSLIPTSEGKFALPYNGKYSPCM